MFNCLFQSVTYNLAISTSCRGLRSYIMDNTQRIAFSLYDHQDFKVILSHSHHGFMKKKKEPSAIIIL